MRFVTDDNAVISYDVTGKGSPIVIVHGWDANRHFFDKNIPELAKSHQVVSFDLRGHGESDRSERSERHLTLDRFAKDLRQLIEILGLTDVTLAGWSMGTSIALDYIRQFGCENLRKLCLIDMTPKLLCDGDWNLGLYENFHHADNLTFLALMTNDWEDAVTAFVPAIFAKSGTARKADIAWASAQARDNTPHVMINMWIQMAAADYRDVLPKVSVPTLLCYSGDGQLYTPNHGKYMQAHIPDSRLVIFENSGHSLQIEEAEKFNRELSSFAA